MIKFYKWLKYEIYEKYIKGHKELLETGNKMTTRVYGTYAEKYYEDAGTCSKCGTSMQLVRPGKSQPNCDCWDK